MSRCVQTFYWYCTSIIKENDIYRETIIDLGIPFTEQLSFTQITVGVTVL